MHTVKIEFKNEDDANQFARQLGKIIERNGSQLSTGLMLTAIQRAGEIIAYPAGVIDVQAITPQS